MSQIAAWIGCALLLAGCSPEHGETQPSAGSAAHVDLRNVIIISIDTLRADRLGCYGYERPTSPAIDAFAARAVVFDQAYATSPWTKPSHASLFTGLFPNRHGALSFKSGLASDVPHMAELLKDSGFQTAAIVSNAWMTQDGLERGFDDFTWEKAYHGVRKPTPVTKRAIEWLDGRDETRPFFALIHYMDVHGDYRAMPQYEQEFVGPYEGQHTGTSNQMMYFEMGLMTLDETDAAFLSDKYDAGIRQIDDQLQALFQYLQSEGLFDSSLVILLSDHGEQFLEHGGIHHSHTQYEEVVRIPFMMRAADLPAGERVSPPVSLVDVLPTVFEWLALPVPPDLDGMAIGAPWSGQGSGLEGERPLFFDASCAFPRRNAKPLRRGPYHAVREGRFKLHYHSVQRTTELYDLVADPGETTDVSAEYPEVRERLLAKLETYFANRIAPTASVFKSAEFMADIRAMGYAGADEDD